MQQKTKDKIQALTTRSFKSLPVAQDLPRLLKSIRLHNRNEKVFPPKNDADLSTFDLLRCLVFSISDILGDVEVKTTLEKTFEKHFKKDYLKPTSNISTISPSPVKVEIKDGLESLQDEKLKEALRFLPKVFLGSSESATFLLQLDRPNSNIILQISQAKGLQISPLQPDQTINHDCKIRCATNSFVSIVNGSASAQETLKSGQMIVEPLQKLFVFAKTFKFDKKTFDDYRNSTTTANISSTVNNSTSSSSTTITSTESALKIPVSTIISKYFDEVLTDEHIITKIVKVLNSATISPAIIELKFALGTQYMTKDVPGTWFFDMTLDKQNKQIDLKTKKSETDLKGVFRYTWELLIEFSLQMESKNMNLSILDATVYKMDHMEDIKKILSTYVKDGDLFEWKDGNAQLHKSSTNLLALAATPSVINEVARKGKETYSTGDIYDGEFNSQGLRHGSGIYTTSHGDTYSGHFRNGFRSGYGVYTTKEGSRYEGDFKDGKPNGKGMYVFENGDVYTGDFEDEEFHGKGTWSSDDGSSYVGSFEHGKRSGYGVMFSKGTTYDGEWKNGVFYGNGTYLYSTGDLYEGEFKNGKFDGYGRYTTTTGVIIEGNFVEGRPVEVPVETRKADLPQIERKEQKDRFENWREENMKKIEARKKIRQIKVNQTQPTTN